MFQPILRNTQGGTAHHIFKILFRQLGSAEEPFSEYEKNFEKPVLSSPRSSKRGQYKPVDDFDEVVIRNNVQGCYPRGGVTLIFSHIRRLGLFFWVQNSEFQYFLGFSEK